MLNDTISTILKDTYMMADKVNDKQDPYMYDFGFRFDDEEDNKKDSQSQPIQPVVILNVFNIGGDALWKK